MARLATSLRILREEINKKYPNRSKALDGWIGDSAHAARASRHNPNQFGVVTALDITHDPAHGLDAHAVADFLVNNPHPEQEYIISNGRIASRLRGWKWRTYTRSPHDKHIHVAVGRGKDSNPLPPYDSTVSWGIANVTGIEKEYIMKNGDRGPEVSWLQARLTELKIAELDPDGKFGDLTEAALKEFQKLSLLPEDGVYDSRTDGVELAVKLAEKRLAVVKHAHEVLVKLS